MVQLILAVVSTVAFVVFCMANTHHVELSYVFGEPLKIRLIFLLTIAFLCGSLGTVFYQLTARVIRRASDRERRLRLRLAAETRRELVGQTAGIRLRVIPPVGKEYAAGGASRIHHVVPNFT